MARCIAKIRKHAPRARVIYDAEAIFAMREVLRLAQDDASDSMPFSDAPPVRKELLLAGKADAIWAISPRDALYFQKVKESDVYVVGHLPELRLSPEAFNERTNILWVGSISRPGSPNEEAVLDFVESSLPKLVKLIPVRLAIAGICCAETRKKIARSPMAGMIDILGPQPSLGKLYSAYRIFVAPTRCGAGIPLKVVDAAAYGIPCVITPLLASQLEWTHDREALVGRGADDFAAQCFKLLTDRQVWERIRTSAFERVSVQYGSEPFARAIVSSLA